MDNEAKSKLADATIAECDHVAEFPGRNDTQQRAPQLRRIKRLECQMQEDGGVLADGIEQHRLLALDHSLADDVDAFGLELFEVRELPGATKTIWRCQRPLRRVDSRQHHIHGIDPLWLGYAGSDRRVRAGWRAWSPHSFFSSCSHHHRPARSGSPSATARVHGS